MLAEVVLLVLTAIVSGLGYMIKKLIAKFDDIDERLDECVTRDAVLQLINLHIKPLEARAERIEGKLDQLILLLINNKNKDN